MGTVFDRMHRFVEVIGRLEIKLATALTSALTLHRTYFFEQLVFLSMIKKSCRLACFIVVVYTLLFGFFVPPRQVGTRSYRSTSRFACFEGLYAFLDYSQLANFIGCKQLKNTRSYQK